ncbi:unnamed protein product [Mortierella alpina]
MNPKRKAAAAAALASASGSGPAAVTTPVPTSVSDSDPPSVTDPASAAPALETAALEAQASSPQPPQGSAISIETPPHTNTKEEEDMSERVGLTTVQGDLQNTAVEHESPPETTTAAAARSLSPVPFPSVETTGTTYTESAATLADSSEATLDSAAEPDTEELSDTFNPSKKRVGSEQDKGGIRGGGAKRRFTNPKPGRRLVG